MLRAFADDCATSTGSASLAATEELNPPPSATGLGLGHCPAIVYRPLPYPTGSTPANGILPRLAFAITTCVIVNCLLPSTGTVMFGIVSS
jgi:hypothetical protein